MYILCTSVDHFCLSNHFFRKLRQRDATKLHIQLSLALMCMLVVFVAGIDHTENKAGCVTVGVLLHYFLLAAWMWMGAESLMLFQKLVIVFVNITTKYLFILSLICWSEYIISRNTQFHAIIIMG